MALRGAFGESIQQPAWKTIPSWYLVVQEDKAINPDLERFYAKRMGAKTTETRGGGGEVAPEGDRQSSEEINHLRRRFLGTAGVALAAAQLVAIDSANAQSGKTNPGMNTTFDLLKKIDAGVLNVGYAEAGSVGAPVVVLLHGWPYDIHSYWRLGLAEGGSKYDELEKRLAEAPAITVPTITLEGDANGAPHSDAASYAKKFSGKYLHRVVTSGMGHNLPQEAPQAFADAVVEVDNY